ncbi:MAG: hypothetical protein WC178_01000 [Candidatus Paceibacterota bacterium]
MQDYLNKKKIFILAIIILLLWKVIPVYWIIYFMPFLAFLPLFVVVIYFAWGMILKMKRSSDLTTAHEIFMEFPAAYFAAAVLAFSFQPYPVDSFYPLYNLSRFALMSSIIITPVYLLWMYLKGLYVLISPIRNKYGLDLLSYAVLDTVAIFAIIIIFGILLTPGTH